MFNNGSLLRAVNKSTGYRWSPIPKPPPRHTDRLYGTHSVLNTLRAFAKSEAAATVFSSCAASRSEEATASHIQQQQQQQTLPPLHHPHRPFINCLYVRDFSVEGADGGNKEGGGGGSSRARRIIPPSYTALHRITALAKHLEVPVRFVPRKELVQLCGERRNQNVVLEVATFRPTPVASIMEVLSEKYVSLLTGGDTARYSTCEHATEGQEEWDDVLVLYLDRIVDPTNVGSILRTAFFFGVDYVVLSPDCASCTPVVARTSTGFLEYMSVCRSTVSTEQFLRKTLAEMQAQPHQQTRERFLMDFQLIASVVRTSPPQQQQQRRTQRGEREDEAHTDVKASESSEAVQATSSMSSSLFSSPSIVEKDGRRTVKVLLLGNEDTGIAESVVAMCTHAIHVRSPRQRRLREAETRAYVQAADTLNNSSEDTDVEGGEASVVEQRARNAKRLMKLRPQEVSLNVNTACATLLSRLVSGDGGGMVELTSMAAAAAPLASSRSARSSSSVTPLSSTSMTGARNENGSKKK